ncbi:hypothetical protein [Rhizobium leguminosarum]|uniref:hypothetical protein n=1 Tax=Rhizobium leguminosarum TaxID=384 RepID=UPI003F9A12EC
MPAVRTEFSVQGDVVLAPDANSGELFRSESHIIRLRNAPPDAQGHVPSLIGEVIGSAESLKSALDEHRAILAAKLNLLSLVTRARFKIDRPIRAIEWEPGVSERSMLVVHQQDARYPPEPILEDPFLSAVSTLADADLPAYLDKAATYFRYGILEESPTDQFVKFWHALEIIAENDRPSDRIPIYCHECKDALACSHCKAQATRLPLPKDAIMQVMQRIGVQPLGPTLARQLNARNTLMHGGTSAGVEAKCKFPMTAIVNELGGIVQAAIINGIRLKQATSLGIDVGSDLSNVVLSGVMELKFRYDGSESHPPDDAIPKPQIQVISTWNGS